MSIKSQAAPHLLVANKYQGHHDDRLGDGNNQYE